MSFRTFVCLLLLITSSFSFAQFQHLQKNGSVRVQLFFTDGQPCHLRLRVVLWPKANYLAVSQTFTSDECRAEFGALTSGEYYIEVSGMGIENAQSPIFEVGQTTQSINITVKHLESAAAVPRSPTVSVTDLNIPDKARKEFEKASVLIAKKDWNKALDHLNKAVASFPQYVEAYNNLGVVYARLGERDQERESLEKAVSLNDHYAPALTNLASMAIVDKNLPQAEGLLNRVTAINPADVPSLVLLAKIELLNQHFEDALATCRKVHSLQHGSEALVHYIAARALEGEHRNADAVTELHTFLDEQPTGPSADLARREMAVLEQQIN